MSSDKPTMIAFNQLVRSEKNVRRNHRSRNIDALAASIAVQGVLQNLVVSPTDGGLYAVDAGDRRFQAIGQLVEQGKRSPDFKVPCKVIEAGNATAASLAENVMREAMHAADEYEAFQQLANEGHTIDFIADAFGVTPLVVERRMKLTAAAPALLAEFRADAITTDQLIALCATENHDRQVEVWNRYKHQHWNSDPKTLRRAVLAEGEVDVSNDPRIPFIGGLATYRDAGGEVRKDLFTGDGSGGFITNEPLLDELVADRLEEHARALRAEGWGWVEVWMEFDHTAFNRFGQAPKTGAELPVDVRATIAALDAEIEALEKEQTDLHGAAEAAGRDFLADEEEERDTAIDERVEAIREEIIQIEDSHCSYSHEVLANSGAIVAFTRNGVRIERGLVRTADRKAVAAAAGVDSAITGGRETESAGRKADTLSDALRRSLLGHRNHAAQAVTATKPDVAKLLLACWTVLHIRNSERLAYHRENAPTNLAITAGNGTRTGHPIADDAGKAARDAFVKMAGRAVAELPKAEGPLWDALAAKTPDQLDNLIAYGVALSVSLDSTGNGLTGKFLAAIDMDMAWHFNATADNYLGKVSKALILEALTEAKKIEGDADRAALLAMKKGVLAAEAEKRLAGTGWVPKLIRSATPKVAKPAAPKVKAPAKPKPAQAAKKAAAPKAPARKAPGKAAASKQVTASA